MKPKYKRFWMLLISLTFFCGFVFFILANLSESISFFYTPSEVASIADDREMRIGGSVKNIQKNPDYTTFIIHDDRAEVEVKYNGLVPKLMQDGIEIIVCGRFQSKKFEASQVLIKHDERYYPKK